MFRSSGGLVYRQAAAHHEQRQDAQEGDDAEGEGEEAGPGLRHPS